MYIYQRIENVTTFANQSVSISVYIKADAAVSMSARLVQNFGSGGSGAVVTTLTGSPASVTTGWVRHTFTATVPSISGKTIGTGSSLEIRFDIPKDGSFVRNGTYDFWGVQVEAGSVATAFQTATGTIQGELSAAQRYYYRISATNSPLSICEMRTTTTAGIVVPMAVTMRTSPTLDASSGTNYFIAKVANTNHNISGAWTLDIASPTASELFATTGTTATAGNAGFVYLNNASAYLGFSAEL
jgi:hypothetical protein